MASIFAALGEARADAPADAAHNARRASDARRIAFSIGAGPLAAAVRSFVLATGVSVSYEPGTVKGRNSAGVQGRFSVGEALARMLAGTGVVAVAQDNGDFVLRPAQPGAPQGPGAVAGLPPVSVQGQASAFTGQSAGSTRLTAADIDTPRSLVVIPAEILRETGAASLVDALRTVPGVSFRGADAVTAPAGDRPFIRGFDAANAVMVDGMRSAGPQGREMFAVEQVEVIEGPASVYSGRGGGGGSVNLVSKVPRAVNAAESVTGVGTSGYLRQTADINRVLSDDVAARLNVMWQDSAKAGREQVTATRWGVAPSVSFGMIGATRLTLSYYHLHNSEMPDYSTPYARGGGAPVSTDLPYFGLLARDYLHTTTDIAQADVRQRLDNGVTLRNLTQYARVSQSFIATNPQWAGPSGDLLSLQAKNGIFDIRSMANQTELSGIHDSGWASHSWTAGVDLASERGMRDAYDIRDEAGNNLTANAGCAVLYNCTPASQWNVGAPWTGSINGPSGAMTTVTRTETAAAYLLDTLRLNEAWLVNVGLRRDYFRTRASGAGAASSSDGMWNYQLGAVLKPTDRSSLYASLSTSANPVGAEAGTGTDTISAATQNLSPERARNVELGIKLDNAAHSLSMTLAVFRTIKSNARISISRDTLSGATQRVRGIEAGVRGNLTPAWKIFAGATLLDAVIEDGGTMPAYSGNAFPMTPRKSFALWSSYRSGPWNGGAGVTYSDRIFANASNTNYVPSYTRFDAMLSYDVDAHVQLQLNVYNLGDKRYYDIAYPVYASIAARRAAVLSARVKF